MLMYHSIATDDVDPYGVTVTPDHFYQQMRWLRERGFQGASVRSVLAQNRQQAKRLVGLTFDDGYADVLTHAVPVLQHFGFSATVFVLPGLLGCNNTWSERGPRKVLVTAEQVGCLVQAGLEVGSHGMHHVSLPSTTEDTVIDEVTRSKERLERIIDGGVNGFCYPYGDVDQKTVDCVRTAGYDYACAIWPSALTSRYALTRTYVNDRDSGLRLQLKQLHHRVPIGRRRDVGTRLAAKRAREWLASG